MKIDFRADAAHAARYEVRDALTGRVLDLPIFSADDATGVVRSYVRDELGYRYSAGRAGLEIVERHLPIRIVLKPAEPPAP